jgi:hypothetical protein
MPEFAGAMQEKNESEILFSITSKTKPSRKYPVETTTLPGRVSTYITVFKKIATRVKCRYNLRISGAFAENSID